MKKIMNLMINSCKKTTELIDKQQITSLTTKEKFVANWFSAKSQTTVRLDDEKKKKIIEEINRS